MSNAKPIAAIAQINHWVGVSPREGPVGLFGMACLVSGVAAGNDAGDKVYFTMVPFELHPRTRVVFGPGCVERVGAAAREMKLQRVLLVADPGLVEAGRVETVRRSLDAASIAVFAYHEFGENPDSAM